jgi:hypothetical protein
MSKILKLTDVSQIQEYFTVDFNIDVNAKCLELMRQAEEASKSIDIKTIDWTLHV